MYPLLLEFDKEFDKTDALEFIVKNIGNTTVKNGEYSGQNIKDTLRLFGKDALGKNGKNTALFRSDTEKEQLVLKINNNRKTGDNPDDTVIYPFGVVNKIISGEDITAEELKLDGKAGIYEENSFLLIFVKEHDCLVSDFDSTMKAEKNRAVFLPAKTRIELLGEADLILVYK